MAHTMFDEKSFAGFNRRFFSAPEILLYEAMAVGGLGFALWRASSVSEIVWPILVIVVLYPVVEYLLHRYLLHARFLAKSPLTAPLWYRIHYRHHSRPGDQSVILASPPTIGSVAVFFAIVVGVIFGSWTAGAAALGTASLLVTAYEYAHSVCHASFATDNAYLKSIRTNHLLHHFHDEHGNFGITNNLSDRLFCSRYDEKSLPARSATVRNLGYDAEMRRAFPWIAHMEAEADRRKGKARAVKASVN